MSERKAEQAGRYIAAQAEFKAKWRDAITSARESTEYFPPEYRLENPTRAQAAFREKFTERAAAVGLQPERAWKEAVDASAYVWVARQEGNPVVDLSTGFTPRDRQRLAETVAQFKADERDRIAFGKQPRTYYNAEDLGLNPVTTDGEVRTAARYVSANKIENPGLTTGFAEVSEKKQSSATRSIGFGY